MARDYVALDDHAERSDRSSEDVCHVRLDRPKRDRRSMVGPCSARRDFENDPAIVG
jgi:hypothetical protein